MKFKIIFFCLLLLVGCNNKDKPLNDAVLKIEQKLPEKDLQQFSKTEEMKAVGDFHLRYGMALRNGVLRDKNDSTLLKYFNSKGIYHFDDMSSIIFKSLHRKLNHEKINLEQQINEKIEYWKPYEECEELKKRILKKNDKYIKGDTIQIRMRINKIDNCAYPIDCLNMHSDWKYDDYKDLLIKGIILNKYYYDYTEENKFIKIRILELNKKNIYAPRKIFNVGDEFEAVLNYDIIDPAGPSRNNTNR